MSSLDLGRLVSTSMLAEQPHPISLRKVESATTSLTQLRCTGAALQRPWLALSASATRPRAAHSVTAPHVQR